MSTEASQETGNTLFPIDSRWGVLPLVRKSSEQETIGQRLARLRKEKGLTQVELAQQLAVTQSQMSDYERDVIRLHGELIVQLTQILGVSADALLGLEKDDKANATVKNRRLLRQVQSIDKLSKRDQQALLRTIEAFLSKVQ